MEQNTSADIGLRIKTRREELNLTQEELAAQVGVSRIVVHNWEHGKRGIKASTLPALAAALQISIPRLCGDEEEEGPTISSYYNGLSPARRATADEIIRALWLEDQRAETTHGKKAE